MWYVAILLKWVKIGKGGALDAARAPCARRRDLAVWPGQVAVD